VADQPTNRRGLLRALVKTAGQALGEFTDAVNAGQEAAERAAPKPEPVARPEPLTQVLPATRTLTEAELLDLADEEGLGPRREALRGLVRPATRLTPTVAVGAHRSWIGRPPEAGAPADGTAAPVAEIDLADDALAGGALAAAGRLVVQIAAPQGAPVPPCSRARLHVEPEADEQRPTGRTMHLSTELTLPRVWAAPVQALGLDDAEQQAYVRLRERVAGLQGVTAEDGDAEGVARHHLLGYPTETSGTMPLVCELAARGLDPDAAPGDMPEDLAAAAERWRLLLQLTQDVGSGVTLGDGVERLFLWIAGDRLGRHDFSEVWAIAR
jgi:Domain of unknown function (DUF1963)